MKRKIYLIGIVFLFVMTLMGCQMGQETTEAQNASAKEYVYHMESLNYEDDRCTNILKGGDNLYAYGYYWEEGKPQQLKLKILNPDGSIKEENEILFEQNESCYELVADKAGYIYGIKIMVNEDPENYQESFALMKYTPQGEEVFCIDLNNMPELQELKEDDYFYTGSVMPKDDFLYVNIMGKYVKFDCDGNFVKILQSTGETIYDNAQFYALLNGKVGALCYEDTGTYVAYVDLETGEVSQKTKIPGNSYEYSVYAGIGYDFYLVNSYGVFGYNVGDTELSPIMNYINSDFESYSLYQLVPISETEFFATYDTMDTGETMVGRFTKVDPADVKDKDIIVLACNGLDWSIRTAIIDFNKTNENYKISIQDYASLYGDENDYMAGINRFNTDIISGKIPDIIVLDSSMPIQSYISKGLLEDIKPYIEKDEEFDLNHYMPNIIEAFSTDGKLYQLVPFYYINSMAAKTSVVGEERGWTVQEAMELMENSPEGTQLISGETRSTMLNNCLAMAGNQFVDWKTGTCNFESQDFIALLNFLALFPEEVDEAVYTDEYWANYESMWREDKVIAMPMNLFDFSNYNYNQEGTFGEKITMIGFPAGNGDGSAIVPGMQFALSAKSAYKEGAWEFLRYFLTEECQEEMSSFGFPLSIRQLDAMGEEATKIPTYTDENGNEIEAPQSYYINGIEIPIEPMTKEEVVAFKDQLYSFTNVYNYDSKLIQIVEEESAGFFSGQKSAEEVAKIIQSRATIYVNENR